MSTTAIPGEDTRPLTDRERTLLTRLLSDPTIYPVAFKNWLPAFLEASDMDLSLSHVHGLTSQLGGLVVGLAAVAATKTLSGTNVVTTDAAGLATVPLPPPVPVTTVSSIVVCNGDTGAIPGVWVGVQSWTASDFVIAARTNVPYTGNVRINWIAVVVP